MSVERNLPVVRERKLSILKGDPDLCAKQKKAGKLLARERVALLLDASSFVELDVLNLRARLHRQGRFGRRAACQEGAQGDGAGRKDRLAVDRHS